MEQAARAALATRGHEPKTHSGLVQAFNNQLVRSGEMDTKWAERIAEGSAARNTADYAAFYRANAKEAQQSCADAAELLKDTREYLVKKGLRDLAEVPGVPGRKPVTPGGDPGFTNPGGRPKVDAPPRGSQQERNRRKE